MREHESQARYANSLKGTLHEFEEQWTVAQRIISERYLINIDDVARIEMFSRKF